jgi:hypothetical protein
MLVQRLILSGRAEILNSFRVRGERHFLPIHSAHLLRSEYPATFVGNLKRIANAFLQEVAPGG